MNTAQKRLICILMFGVVLIFGACTGQIKTEDGEINKLGLASGIQMKSIFNEDGTLRTAPDFDNPMYGYDFRVTALNGYTADNGIKVAQFSIMNKTSSTLNLQYRFSWLDANGIELSPGTGGWLANQLYSYETKNLSGVARSSRAQQVIIYVREIN
jgi:hypothetical protein